MNLNLVKAIILTSLIALATSCSKYTQLIKSGDHELMYTEALKYFEAGKYDKTIALFGEIGYMYASTPKEDTIAYYTARSYYMNGDLVTSGALFNEFRRKYRNSAFIEDAEYLYTRGIYFSSPSANRDQTETVKGIMAIQEYLERYPNSIKRDTLLHNIDELVVKLHDKSYLNAKTYYKIGEYKSAVVALKNASREFPESKHTEELAYLVVKSNYLYASKSRNDLQRDRYLDMMDAYYTFVSDFPESKYRKEIEKLTEAAKKYLDQFNDDSKVKVEKENSKEDQKRNNIKNDNKDNTESNDGN